MTIDFVWQRCVDGYAVVKNKNEGVHYIVPKTGRAECFRPFDIHSAILCIFSEKTNVSGYVDFANKFGLLNHEAAPELLSQFELQSYEFRTMLELYNRGNLNAVAANFNKLKGRDIFLQFNTAHDPPTLCYSATNLLQAMWLQFGEMIIHEEKQEMCALCNEWFAVGPTTNRRRRRFNAKRSFCCDAHAKRYEYINRKNT
ncbi:MAG: hypothetical protein CMF69_07165 [Magnetovibrio sp.]|nr:hypothetical protein [Magnetovibrio sp.]|tara:strand:+ start:2554 stop:3153 length:600 start_codon:yes stop_codon:yes gene_type:complete